MQSWEALDFTNETEPTLKKMGTMREGVEEKLTLWRLQKVAEKKTRKISSNNCKSKAIWIRLQQICLKRRQSTGKQEKQEKHFVLYDFGTEYE